MRSTPRNRLRLRANLVSLLRNLAGLFFHSYFGKPRRKGALPCAGEFASPNWDITLNLGKPKRRRIAGSLEDREADLRLRRVIQAKRAFADARHGFAFQAQREFRGQLCSIGRKIFTAFVPKCRPVDEAKTT